VQCSAHWGLTQPFGARVCIPQVDGDIVGDWISGGDGAGVDGCALSGIALDGLRPKTLSTSATQLKCVGSLSVIVIFSCSLATAFIHLFHPVSPFHFQLLFLPLLWALHCPVV